MSSQSAAAGTPPLDTSSSAATPPDGAPRASTPSPATATPRRGLGALGTPECEARWQEILTQPAAPGAQGFDAKRAVLLARAKAEPIVFLRTPQWGPPSSATVGSYRRHLQAATHHWDAVVFQLRRFRARPDIGREVLLRDGYLYAEHPHLAYAFEQLVGPEHLFDADRIWIQRGDRVYWARRTNVGEYVYEQSPEAAPEPVNLLHLDRIGAGEPPEPLHVDVRAFRRRTHFDTLELAHLTSTHVLAELSYGTQVAKVVLERHGARLEPSCEVPSRSPEELRGAKSRAARRGAAVALLQDAMHEQVVDAPPFDEPRDERGVEDGVLRPLWQEAYDRGRRYFHLREEVYEVFNGRGRPVPPQVCFDFLTDTFELASGSWWNELGRPPQRRVGGLDLSQFDELKLRRVSDFVDFARKKPEWFELYETTPNERIPIGHRERFFPGLIDAADPLHAGDIVIVRGHTEDDRVRMHTHSFFIYETDPLTGVPIAVVGNAGMPHIWSLEGESRREPGRTIRYRLRPRDELLYKVLAGRADVGHQPSPLVEEDI